MRDTDLHDNDVRTAGRPVRRAGSWVAPLIILALVVGVGWWVMDRARNDDSVLNIDTPAATDAGIPAGAPIQTATGTVNQIDTARRTVTLDNGDTFTLATNVPNAESLTPGQRVTLTYRLDNNQRIVQSVAAAAGGTPAPAGNLIPGVTPNPTAAPNGPPRTTP